MSPFYVILSVTDEFSDSCKAINVFSDYLKVISLDHVSTEQFAIKSKLFFDLRRLTLTTLEAK